MIEVIRHPWAAFTVDSLGESTAKQFHDDESWYASQISPGSSDESSDDTDTTITGRCQLLFAGKQVPSTGHDEWTVNGLRWEQDGASETWPMGTVIDLVRRTG